MRYHITIDDETYQPTRLIETPWAQYSANRAYFCPQCGRIWARWTLENVDPLSLGSWYNAYHVSCREHQYGMWRGDNPGCLLLSPADASVLPRELLLRELFLMTAPPVADETGPPDFELT